MAKSINWPEELFGDRNVEDALKLLENARSKYYLSGTRSGKNKVTQLNELMSQLNNLIHK
jgi:hypothetical protein